MVICSSLHCQRYIWYITEDIEGEGEKKKSNLAFTRLLKGDISLELFKLDRRVIILCNGKSRSKQEVL